MESSALPNSVHCLSDGSHTETLAISNGRWMAVVTTVYCNAIRSDPLSSPLAHIDPSGLDLLKADSLTLSFSIMLQNNRAMYSVARHAVVV